MTRTSSNQDIDLHEVLSILREGKNRALHVMEICARLDLPGQRRDDARAALDALCAEGVAQELPGLRFRALKAHEIKRKQPEPREVPRGQSDAPRKVAPSAKLGVLRIQA